MLCESILAQSICGKAFAHFAYFMGLIAGFDFVNHFHAGALADGASASPSINQLLDLFSTVCFWHWGLLLFHKYLSCFENVKILKAAVKSMNFLK